MQTLALYLEYCETSDSYAEQLWRPQPHPCAQPEGGDAADGVEETGSVVSAVVLPTILLANVRSLDKQLDHLRLRRTTWREIRDCCAFVFTETWLNDNTPDSAVQLDGLCLHRADRNTLSGKSRGGGL